MSELSTTDMPSGNAVLELALDSGIRMSKEPESPVLDQAQPGIALAVSAAELDEGRLRLRVHLSLKLPGAVAMTHHQLGQAVLVSVHDVEGKRLGVCSMLDPNKRFPGYQGSNYTGPRELDGGGMMLTRYYGVDLGFLVGIPEDADAGPSVFVSASFNRLRSELVRITVAGATPKIEPEAARQELPAEPEPDTDQGQEDQP